jgi:transposase
MTPFPGPKSVLVLDNLAVHHCPEFLDILEAKGYRWVFLPPYSPEWNPIENLFSQLKAILRRSGLTDRDLPMTTIINYLASSIPTEDCTNYIRHAGYLIQNPNEN